MAHYEIRLAGSVPCEAIGGLDHLTATSQPVHTVLYGMLGQRTLRQLLARLELLGAHVVEVRSWKAPPYSRPAHPLLGGDSAFT